MINPDLSHEQSLWSQGLITVAGVDEVGRGAWAGPVVAAAVCLSPQTVVHDSLQQQSIRLPQLLRDSKKLSANQRQQLSAQLQKLASQWAVGQAEVEEINKLGIGPANELAMRRALASLPDPAAFALVDGFGILSLDQHNQKAIIKGDTTVASIAAASIIAKVHRDAHMEELSAEYPEYGFAQHKGYGTKLHQQAILQHGLSPVHRTGYKLKFLS